MNAIRPYLTFDGNAREAMTFYQKCLGGELFVMTFGEAKMRGPTGTEDRLVHARITNGSAALMGSDTMPGMPFTAGDNFSVSIDCESRDEIEKLFAALGEGGKVTMPLQDTFWNSYFGMLTDRFGINWRFNYPLSTSG